VRAIFRWVCENVSFTFTAPASTAAIVLANRVANAEGFSNLYLALCETAGFDCIKIRGYGKSDTHPLLTKHPS
jgi:transglutaminase-like putative cysteine protease